jgi:isoamylase
MGDPGVNVAVFSGVADQVELCLFDAPDDTAESCRVVLPASTGDVWHGYFPGLRPGQLYGLRVTGPYRPAEGPRCNPHKLLFDPWARAVGRDVRHDDSLFGYALGSTDEDLTYNLADSAASAPLAAVVDPAFPWGGDARPRRAPEDEVIYELHVKGFTERHPRVPAAVRGTYAGLASPAAVEHLLALGVTAVQLLPVQYRVTERVLVEQGLTNYSGYNTLGFLAPDPRLAAAADPQGVVREFQTMVATLHAAGIAVLLDVACDHTAEGGEFGPTLSFRGLDNAAYYRLAEERRYTHDDRGRGNALNLDHPRTRQLIADSLRHWVSVMHVDGFRFDLEPAPGRAFERYDELADLVRLVEQDPVLAGVHLIAGPEDASGDALAAGSVPDHWWACSDRYRSTVRRFWAGAAQRPGELTAQLLGPPMPTADDDRRGPTRINLVTGHDGSTLTDLVSYLGPDATDRRDGGSARAGSRIGGVEGPTTDPAVAALRQRQVRSLLLTLVLSRGVPMLQAGDEFGHTQLGDDHAWTRDDELTWLDWAWDDERRALVDFTVRLLRLRADEPAFRRPGSPPGRPPTASGVEDVRWRDAAGQELQPDTHGRVRPLAALLISDPDGRSRAGTGFLLLFNATDAPVGVVLPARLTTPEKHVLLDTAGADGESRRVREHYDLPAHSAAVLLVPGLGS